MKVICAYCDSYVEIEGQEICPHCGASLAEAVREAKEEQRAEQQRAYEAEIQQKREEREAEETSRILDIAAGILGIGASSGFLRRTLRKHIIKEIRSSIRR